MSAMVGDRTLTHLLLEWSAVTRRFLWLKPTPPKKEWLSQYKNPCPPPKTYHLRRLEVKDFVEQKPGGEIFWKGQRYVG